MPAANQFQALYEHVSEENEAAADRIVGRIREAIFAATRMPRMGRIGRVRGTREIAVPGTPYLIAYRIADRQIHILAILHGAQDWPKSFE